MLKELFQRLTGAETPRAALATAARLLRRGEPAHRDFLLNLLPKHSVGAEIGVHTGDFSARILQTVRPTALHLIDPWKHEPSAEYAKALYGGKAAGGQTEMDERFAAVGARFEQQVRAGRVLIHRDVAARALAVFPNEYFDWVYIDGNHLYEYVRQDLELAFAKTKAGGYITGDDYTEAVGGRTA